MVKKKVKNKDEPVKRGAPVKPSDNRVDDVTHLYVWQRKRNQQEAQVRGITEFAFERMIHDWFYTALDTARSDVSASKLFDDKFKEEVIGNE